jgi:hypothetical protein
MIRGLMFALALMVPLEPAAGSDVFVHPDPLDLLVERGEVFEIRLLADISDPVLGWGLDLSLAPGVLSVVGAPSISSPWQSVPAADGDGLAAYAFPDSVSGQDTLLATLTFSADAVGETDLVLSVTPGDLTEGFPLDPSGFATSTFQTGHVTVVPEPGAALVAAAGWVLLAIWRKKDMVRAGLCQK